MDSSILTTLDIVVLIASAFSLALAGVAIFLSFTFFKMSNDNAKETNQAAINIQRSVTELDTHLGRLHTDTFGLTREMVRNLERRVPGINTDTDIEQTFNDRLKEHKEELVSQFTAVINEIRSSPIDTANEMAGMQNELAKMIDQATNLPRKTEAEVWTEILRGGILSVLAEVEETALFDSSDIFHLLVDKRGISYPRESIQAELNRMEEEHLIADARRGSRRLKEYQKIS